MPSPARFRTDHLRHRPLCQAREPRAPSDHGRISRPLAPIVLFERAPRSPSDVAQDIEVGIGHRVASASSAVAGVVALRIPHLPLAGTCLQRVILEPVPEHLELLVRGVAQSKQRDFLVAWI